MSVRRVSLLNLLLLSALLVTLLSAVLFLLFTGLRPHSVILKWQGTPGATYNVYRSDGAKYERIADGVSSQTFTDYAVRSGTYSYRVSAVAGGRVSPVSSAVTATVPH
jgi:hypothetical protein